MKIVFTKHALRKQEILKEMGWEINLDLVEKTIIEPGFKGRTRHKQPTAHRYLDDEHILRVVYKVGGDIITVITIHPARRGRYEK